jgi:hypothetical protein
MIDGYYPFPGDIQALQRLPERCDCRSSSCPAKRSKRDICKCNMRLTRKTHTAPA